MHRKVTLQHYNLTHHGKDKGRTILPDGSVIGAYDDNPIINALAYDVEFENRDVREHMTNAIGENMLARAYADGHITMESHAILNHRKDYVAYELKDKHVSLFWDFCHEEAVF